MTWYQDNRELSIARAREYNKKHKEVLAQRAKVRRAKDPEKHRKRSSEWYEKNKEKVAARLKAQRDSDPSYQTRRQIKRSEPERVLRLKAKRFGITYEELIVLYEKQNYCCALCKRPEVKLKRRLAIDHCHDTGRIRGLLCGVCNTALGKLGDTVESLLRVRKYLEG